MSDDGLTLTVPPAFARALRDAVEAGEYASAEEALADAPETWARRHEDREEELSWVRARLRASLLDPRPSLSMTEVRAHMEEGFRRAEQGDAAA